MKKRRIMSMFLAASLLISLAAPALAAETADTIRLTKTDGTVAVNKSSGKNSPSCPTCAFTTATMW